MTSDNCRELIPDGVDRREDLAPEELHNRKSCQADIGITQKKSYYFNINYHFGLKFACIFSCL